MAPDAWWTHCTCGVKWMCETIPFDSGGSAIKITVGVTTKQFQCSRSIGCQGFHHTFICANGCKPHKYVRAEASKWMYFWDTDPGPGKYIHLRKWLYFVKSPGPVMYFGKLDPKMPKYIVGASKRDKYIHLRKWLYFADIDPRPGKYIHLPPWVHHARDGSCFWNFKHIHFIPWTFFELTLKSLCVTDVHSSISK